MKLTAVPEEPIAGTVGRPFIFLIRDIETGSILFIGRVMNPIRQLGFSFTFTQETQAKD